MYVCRVRVTITECASNPWSTTHIIVLIRGSIMARVRVRGRLRGSSCTLLWKGPPVRGSTSAPRGHSRGLWAAPSSRTLWIGRQYRIGHDVGHETMRKGRNGLADVERGVPYSYLY